MGSVNIATIATSISRYSVSGVTITDINKIPSSVESRQCPIMFPDPDNFVTNFSLTRASFGTDTSAKKDVSYTLNYIFLYAPAGGTRSMTQAIDGMVDKVAAILNAFADDSSPSGAVDATPVLGDFGVLESPDGKVNFFGCRIAIEIETFYEVN